MDDLDRSQTEADRSGDEATAPDNAGPADAPTVVDLMLDAGEDACSDFEHRRIFASVRRRLFDRGTKPKIGRFEVESRLGAGGMGEVYLCRDRDLNRKVAVKRVLGPLADEHEQERLRREAQALAQLSDANVVQVYEIGEHEGRLFVAMEYVEGQTLAQWQRAEARSWRAVVEQYLRAGRGLAAAHAVDIVHRDFKPDNVLIRRDGSVRVVDFGLAVVNADGEPVASDHEAQLDGAGAVAGTVRYMALEQLLGRAIDTRSDQFSFCVALYEAVWGEPPFPDADLQARARALEREAAKVPSKHLALWRVVRRGLRREPERRWSSMNALLAALEGVLLRRRRSLFVLTLVGVAAASVGAFAWADAGVDCRAVASELDGVWDGARAELVGAHVAGLDTRHGEDSWARVRQRLDGWREAWLAERGRVCEARARMGGEVERLRRQDDCLTRQRRRVELFVDSLGRGDGDVLARAVRRSAQLPDPTSCAHSQALDLPPPALRSAIEALRAELDRARELGRVGQLEDARALASSIDAMAEELGYGPLLAEARAELAMAEDRLEAPRRAAPLYDEAIDLAERHRHDALAARLWIERAELELDDFDDPSAAEDGMRRAEVDYTRSASFDTLARARWLFDLGRIAKRRGQLEQAEAHYREAIAVLDGHESPEEAIYLGHLATIVARQERHEEALELRGEALELCVRRFGPHHPRTATCHFNYAQALRQLGEGGREHFELAAEIWLDSYGQPNPRAAKAYLLLGQDALYRGDYEAVRAYAGRIAEIYEQAPPSEGSDRGEVDQLLALAAAKAGQPELALEHTRAAMAWFERSSDGPGDIRALSMRRWAASQLVELDRSEEARRVLEEMLEHAKDNARFEIEAHLGLADLHLRAEDFEAADAALEAAERVDAPMAGVELDHALLRAITDLRTGRLSPARVDELHAARARAELDDEAWVRWLDSFELSAKDRRALGL